MVIGVIDVDRESNGYTRFPNIALMKISAWHKNKGDQVEWYSPFSEYDIVYMSKVYSFTEDYRYSIPNAKQIIKGGGGYSLKLVNGKEVFDKSKDKDLPAEIEHIYPDYSLYPELTKDTAYGFLTRGCPRHCSFCIVGDKEGVVSHKVADLSEFWNGQKNICLCDPNIFACKDWKGLLQQLAKSGSYVDFNQGLDARLLTEEKVEMLNNIRIKEVHFAWDRYQDGAIVLPKLEMFQQRFRRKIFPGNAIVYTLVNYDTTFEQDLERIYTLRKMNYYPYVMIYGKEHCDKRYRKLARWVNNRFIWKKCEKFEDYVY